MRIDYIHLKELLRTSFKAIEISKAEFVELLTGKSCPDANMRELTEGCIHSERFECYLINAPDILNAYCRCALSQTLGIRKYMAYIVNPYVLLVFGLDASMSTVTDYYIMSSFEESITSAIMELDGVNNGS